MDLAGWLDRRWYGGHPPGLLLRALSVLFVAVSALRRSLYRRGWLPARRLPVPVIVVGNIGVGGAGKTPLVIALCEALRARGWSPGVVSRGYGRRGRGARRVDATASPDEVGDEPCLIHRRSGCPVAVAARRSEAAELLLAADGIDVLIADDGLQHLALQRDIEIAVLDVGRGIGNGRRLPAGPLRDPPSRLDDCDFLVGNGGDRVDGVARPLTPMGLHGDRAQPLAGGAARPLADWAGQAVHAVAGIGHPQRFFAALRAAGLRPLEHAFPDHHRFTAQDLAFDDGLPVLMTEKDAVKCAAWAQPHWFCVPVAARLPAAWFDAVAGRLQVVSGDRR